MNVVFLSANRFGFEMLKELMKLKCDSVNVRAVITLATDAKTVMYDGLATEMWNEFGVDVYRVKNINEEEDLIRVLNPDVIVMCGWRQIVEKKILDIPHHGVVAFHPTLLPVGRGPAPLINSILSDFSLSGVTMFYASEGLDDGDIIGQEQFYIGRDDYASDVYNKVVECGRKLIAKYMPMLAKGGALRVKQDGSKATLFAKRTLADNKIDLERESIDEAYRKIRALSKPYRGAYIEKDGKKLIIWKAEQMVGLRKPTAAPISGINRPQLHPPCQRAGGAVSTNK